MAAAESGSLRKSLDLIKGRLPRFEIAANDLEVDMTLIVGYGSTSVVYVGRLRREMVVAVKDCALPADGRSEQELMVYLRELDVWSRMSHPNILHFLGFQSSPKSFRICSELCSGGTLFDLLHNCWGVPLRWWQRRKILTDIASAVEHMHMCSTPVMHRDLKSLNVLMLHPVLDDETEPVAKLADFGFARVSVAARQDASTATDLTQNVGTPHWMAPEVAGGTKYHDKVDVFSFSIVLYEVVCRHMAFEELDPEEAVTTFLEGGRPELDPQSVPADTPLPLLDLMRACWDQDPRLRPSFTQVHEELQRIDWPST